MLEKTMTKPANLFSELPVNLPEELIETIVDAADIRVERIVSTGHASPPGFWFDQAESEWVVVLRGEAVLAFEDETQTMRPGDYVLIPPHRKHRVNSTSSKEPTVWLAVFFGGGKKEAQ
jgi:cupin 2 domain-containing protein